MGNRAVVTFANHKDIEKFVDPNGDSETLRGFTEACGDNLVGVYLHWNGGRASIEGFCEACRRMKFRGPASDSYGVARFIQVVCNFLGGDGLSVGVDTLRHSNTDNYDNGVYVVDDNWDIIGREFAHGEQNDYDVNEFANDVLTYMPHKDKEVE